MELSPSYGGHWISMYSCVCIKPKSVIEDLVKPIDSSPATIIIEHPSGEMEVRVDYQNVDDKLDFRSAGVVRTARLIARGEVMVPARLNYSSILEILVRKLTLLLVQQPFIIKHFGHEKGKVLYFHANNLFMY